MADANGFCRRWPMADGPMAGSPMPMADADGLKSLLNNLTMCKNRLSSKHSLNRPADPTADSEASSGEYIVRILISIIPG